MTNKNDALPVVAEPILATVFYHWIEEDQDYDIHDEAAMSGDCHGCVPAYVVRRESWEAIQAERDQLQAELAALREQKPVGYRFKHTLTSGGSKIHTERQEWVNTTIQHGESILSRRSINGDEGIWWQSVIVEPLYAAPLVSANSEFGDAYQGAREDLAIWKKRALEAEQALREEQILTERLGNALNDENGPTYMGEPLVSDKAGATDEKASFNAWYITAEAFKAGDSNGWRGVAWAAWQKRAALTLASELPELNIDDYLRLANEAFGKVVDHDLLGNPITDYHVLMLGSYGPAVKRLVELVLSKNPAALNPLAADLDTMRRKNNEYCEDLATQTARADAAERENAELHGEHTSELLRADRAERALGQAVAFVEAWDDDSQAWVDLKGDIDNILAGSDPTEQKAQTVAADVVQVELRLLKEAEHWLHVYAAPNTKSYWVAAELRALLAARQEGSKV